MNDPATSDTTTVCPENLKPGDLVSGLHGTGPVEVVNVTAMGNDNFEIFYRKDGNPEVQIFNKSDLTDLRLVEEDPWPLDADGHEFKLAAEALRIEMAPFIDPFVMVDASNIDPHPHQIEAVYNRMLPLQPLRFLLADDPGAGKTIMSGLIISELRARGDAERILVIAPGSLVEQWQMEMESKFNLGFELVDRNFAQGARIFQPLLIARLDQIARNEYLIEALCNVEWDLIIVDEAHKMSASRFGQDTKKTKRYQLGEKLSDVTRHLLLLTATPHSGDKYKYQLFLSLLDKDRFRVVDDSLPTPPHEDMMRRVIKEKLLDFEGRPLFPERRSYSLKYELSELEMDLYEAVTDYVSMEMSKARSEIDGDKRRSLAVGFALAALQRRLASSPYAIYRSLQNRRGRLEKELEIANNPELQAEEEKKRIRRLARLSDRQLEDMDYDDFDDSEIEELEQEAIEGIFVSRSPEDIRAEIASVKQLTAQAKQVLDANVDKKWEKLRELLDENRMFNKDGSRRKLIIFSEHRDTLEYLVGKIRTYLGKPAAVVQIHGGKSRQDRLRIQHEFIHNPEVWILVATDAAGEGVNLQRANLMVNYDLPWNPNRLEQRFGRIHRIGQKEVCHLWNLVAHQTREGKVYERLLEKMEEMRAELGDQVFDVLGESFAESSLRDLMIEAIQYGEQPEVQARLFKIIDHDIGKRTAQILGERALYLPTQDPGDVEELRQRMELAQAHKLQPGYIQQFFCEGLDNLGGRIVRRKHGRWQINRIPTSMRSAEVMQKLRVAIAKEYESVCFDKDIATIDPTRGIHLPAELIKVGSPLLTSLIHVLKMRYFDRLAKGTFLLNPGDLSTEVKFLFFLEHDIKNGRDQTVSKRFYYVTIPSEGDPAVFNTPPYIDYAPLNTNQTDLVENWMAEQWSATPREKDARQYAISQLTFPHFQEVAERNQRVVEKKRQAIEERLKKIIEHYDVKAMQQEGLDFEDRNKSGGYSPKRFRQRAEEVQQRLEVRMADLDEEEHLINRPPKTIAGALIIPQGLMDQLETKNDPIVSIPIGRDEVDQRAVEAVMKAEKRLGRVPTEMVHHNPGYDIKSWDLENKRMLFIEVKGRIEGRHEFTVSRTQVLTGQNVPDRYILAVAKIPTETKEEPAVRYRHNPFRDIEIDKLTEKVVLNLDRFWELGSKPF